MQGNLEHFIFSYVVLHQHISKRKKKKDHLFKETMTGPLRKVELTHCKCV